MRRILTLDGGGIHGIFTLQVLREIERQVCATGEGGQRRVLADHFDLIAGTSTGAIIASMVAWGASIDEVERFYCDQASNIFMPATWYRRLSSKFSSDGLSNFLKGYFSEGDGTPANLGTTRIRNLLLLVLRNATTGSPWPISNNPDGHYSKRPAGMSNLEIPLWKLVRASSAAPTYFPPQDIQVGSSTGPKLFQFIDGGVSPYNNPSYLAYLTATLPEYRIGFSIGEENLLLVSVGTGSRKLRYGKGPVQNMHVVGHAKAMIQSLMDSSSQQQDLLCRTTGRCLHGAALDRELGDLVALRGLVSPRAFRYVRYDRNYADQEVKNATKQYHGDWTLDNLRLIPFLQESGTQYAREHVSKEHLF